jgi:uncharacterized YigZ family protein
MIMIDDDSYKTIEGESHGLYREKGSKFIAIAFPVSDTEQVKEITERLKKEYHDARHHCYAYMLGAERKTWRVNDDGEPSGTAGKPILGQINSNELTDILIVVIRYFGGTLLGVSGLINAYRSAAADSIANGVIITQRLTCSVTVGFPFIVLNDIMKIIKENHEIQQISQNFDNDCSVTLSLPLSLEKTITARLLKIPGVRLDKGCDNEQMSK